MKKEDVRITKSKKSLREAVAKLLSTQQFASLTVKQICQEADVNRMTFYKHYSDKYDLLDDCLQQVRNDIHKKCLEIHPDSAKNDPALFCASYLTAVKSVFVSGREFLLEYSRDGDSQLLLSLNKSLRAGIYEMLLELSKYHTLIYGIENTATMLSGAASAFLYELLTKEISADCHETSNRLQCFFKRFFDSGLFVTLNVSLINQ